MNAQFHREKASALKIHSYVLSTWLLGCLVIGWPTPLHAEPPGGGVPVLEIKATNNTAYVSWSGSNFWLQAEEFLESPALWYNAPWAVTDLNSGHTAAVPLEAEARFFRLVQSTTLPPPTSLVAQAGDGNLLVSWNGVSNAAAYNLYIASGPGVRHSNYTNLPNGMLVSGLPGNEFVFYNLTNGVRYYVVATAVSTNGDESADSNEGSDIFGPHGQVQGSIYTEIFDGVDTNHVFLPGVVVSLIGGGGDGVAQLTTDSEGRFVSSSLPGGTYMLCWQAGGFVPGCAPQSIVISNGVAALAPQKIDPVTGKGIVFGRVSLQDGGAPVVEVPMFGISVTATVTLRNAAGRSFGSAIPNSLGEYVIAGATVGTNLILRADLEAAHVETAILTQVSNQVDLVLPNSAPEIQSVTALLAGQPVSFAPPGTNVAVHAMATDVDNDPLHYRWLPDIGADGLMTNDAATVALTLRTNSGPVQAFVLVSDSHGGYALGRLQFATLTDMEFSGFVSVCAANGSVVSNAQVRLNNHFTSTDTNGFFSVTTPANEGNFLLTISAPGFASLYRNFTASSREQNYCLKPLSTLCTSWAGEEIDFVDLSGTTIHLQSNSLFYAGAPYIGPICVSIAAFDPCSSDSIYPASYAAINASNQPAMMLPAATALFQITDPAGQPLSIDPTKPATVKIPLGLACDTNNPAMQPLWDFDPTNGVWRIIGDATNEVEAGNALVFFAPVLQLGLLAVGQAAETTLVTVLPDRTLNQPFLVRLSTQPDPVLINSFIPAKPANKFTVPRGKPVTIEIINLKEAPGEYYSNPNDPNTLRALKDKTVIFRTQQTFNQEEVNLPLSLTNHVSGLKREALTEVSGAGGTEQFLTFNTPKGSLFGLGLDPNFYYEAIAGWKPNRKSIFDWFERAGFVTAGGAYPANYSEDAHALYFNATDLGLARSMHMKKTPGGDGKMNIAYYVINYANLEDALADDGDKSKPKLTGTIATVAMEYSYDAKWKKRYTKFFVFNDNRDLRPEADLDGNGNKLTPNLCVICHGNKPVKLVPAKDDKGTVIRNKTVLSPQDGDVDAHFIPFDLESFTYAKNVGVAQAQFRELNRGIYQYTPMTVAMSNLITGWYGGGLTNGNNNNFKVNFVPDGWTNKPSLYLNTVRVSCRGCHLMRDNEKGFGSYDDFGAANAGFAGSSLVCGSLKMPNAQRTFSIYWGSQAANLIKPGAAVDQPSQLTNEFGKGWCPCPKLP